MKASHGGPVASTSGKMTKPKPMDDRQEKQHTVVQSGSSTSDPVETGSQQGDQKKGGKKVVPWNDKNIDLDLNRDSAANVVTRRISLNKNTIVLCKMISQTESKSLFSDYAALVFQKKTQNGGTYELSMELRLADRLIEALQHIIDQNPKFFNKRT